MSWGRANGTLSYKGFDYACEFKRVKYLRLKFSDKGKFKLSVPFNYTQKAVIAFLDKNEAWINKKFAEFQKKESEKDGRVEFLGRKYELKFDESAARVRIFKDKFGGNLDFKNERENLTNLGANSLNSGVLSGANSLHGGVIVARDEAHFEEFLRKNALKIYGFYLRKWQGHFDKRVVRVSIKKMATRWGSCNGKKGYINLNLRLIAKPLKAIEYVILHELNHLKFPHHQKSFYDEISRLMPDFKKREKMLKRG